MKIDQAVTLASPADGSGAHPHRHRRVRANRVDERLAVVAGVAGGVVAAFADVHPTGSSPLDGVLVAVAVFAVTWAAASAPWWVGAGAAAVASVTAIDPLLTMAAAPAFVAGLWVGLRRRNLSTTRAVVAAVALNVLARSELDGFHGASTLIAAATGVGLFVLGVRRRPSRVRRVAWATTGAVAAVAVLCSLGFTAAAVSARPELSEGNRLARESISALGDGRFADAADGFAAASAAFDTAHDSLSRPWGRTAALVPGLAQNERAVREVARQAAASSADLAAALDAVDVDQLRLVDGHIDVDDVAALGAPLATVAAALDELQVTMADVDSPWLVAPVRDRIGDVDREIADNEAALDNARAAVQLVPGLLGAGGERHYLIAFTTPAEARGLGGFMGNFAEFTAVDGQLTMTRFGRTGELNAGADQGVPRTVTGPEDWLRQYGRYGFTTGEGATTGMVPWSNITMSPDFPSVAAVIAELYPQSGGRTLDGVFALDPYVLAQLVEMTGPIEIPATGEELTADQVVPFLLEDQYRIDDRMERVDLLEDVARQAIDRVLGGALPAPTVLADSLSPLARAGRLVAWSVDPDEQHLFEDLGLAGALPTLDGDDGVAVVVNNAAANKIDTYLERRLRYRATVDPATGQVDGVLVVTLTNTAPASGLPQVVLDNAVDAPVGTNHALVSFYTALPVVSASLDGEDLLFQVDEERGWRTARTVIDVPAGASRTVTLTLSGSLDVSDGYTLATRPQPLVLPEHHDLLVTAADGERLVAFDSLAVEPRRFDAKEGS